MLKSNLFVLFDISHQVCSHNKSPMHTVSEGPLRAWAGGPHDAVAKKARHKSGVVAEGDKSEYARAVDNHNLSLHKTSCDWTGSPVSQSRVLRKKIVNRQAKEIVSESKACLVLETRTRKDTQMHMCTHTHTRFKGHLLHVHMISASLCGHAGAAVLVGFRQACRRGTLGGKYKTSSLHTRSMTQRNGK